MKSKLLFFLGVFFLIFVNKAQDNLWLLDSLLSDNKGDSKIHLKLLDKIDSTKIDNNIELGLLNLNYGVCYSNLRDFDRAIYFLEKSKYLIRLSNKSKLFAKVHNELGRARLLTGDFENSEEDYSKALILYEQDGDSLGQARMLVNLINIYLNKGELDNAAKKLDRLYYYCSMNSQLRIKYLMKRGSVLYRERKKDSAFHYLFKANEEALRVGDTTNLFITYHTISNYYFELGDNINALDFAKKSYDIADSKGNEEYILVAQDLLVSLFIEEGDIDNAGNVAIEALNLAKARNDIYRQATLYLKLGSIYSHKGNNKEAIRYNEKSLALFNQFNNQQGIGTIYCNMGICYRNMEQYKKAEAYLKKSYKISKEINDLTLQRDALEVLYLTLSKQGKYKESIFYIENLQIIKDSIRVAKESKNLEKERNSYQRKIDKYELDNKELELLAIKRKVELDNKELDFTKKKYILLSIVVFFIFSSFIFFLGYRYIIYRKKLEAIESKFALVEKEKNKLLLEIKNVTTQYKNSEDVIKYLENNIAKPQSINTIPQLIGKGLDTDKKCAQFLAEFQIQYRDFYSRLTLNNNQLTNSDIRICALVKLRLSTKEIADVVNVTSAGIRKAKGRIKSKLKVDKDKSLEDYLINL